VIKALIDLLKLLDTHPDSKSILLLLEEKKYIQFHRSCKKQQSMAKSNTSITIETGNRRKLWFNCTKEMCRNERTY